MVKSIRAYHAEILVRDESGGVVKLLVDLDDWYSDADVAVKLAEVMARSVPSAIPGDLTFGELVGILQDITKVLNFKAPVLSARVEPGGQGTDRASIKEWGERVV